MSRSLLARATPTPAKRVHERASRAVHLRRVNALNRRFVAEHGLEVRRGPFAGLRYPGALVADHGDLVAKLVGTYELELAPVVASWVGRIALLVDVGAAEGFYAVGMAVASPGTRVVAYEADPAAREQLRLLAEHNGVADRVELRGACTPGELAALPAGAGTALLSDCEGCEATLLDPAAAPPLTGWPLLVELHDRIVPGVTATIRRRFAPTHDVELIPTRPRAGEDPPELADLHPRDRLRLIGERRAGPMQWAWLRPGGRAAVGD